MRYLLLLMLAACSMDNITGLDGSVPLDTPLLLERWKIAEACSGITRDFGAVHFYAARGGIVNDGEPVSRLWIKSGNRIYLTPPHASDWFVIEHEEMHALLQTGKHPAHYFNGACGNLMSPDH